MFLSHDLLHSFTRLAALSAATDVTYEITHRIFNTNL